jgi:DNA-binding winged helix-turn-helix (wHTH) protein
MKAFAPFRLDPANQCLWRTTGSGEDERILLTPSEFAVLDHLVAHAGRLVTHQELLDAVWPGTAIEPQAVKSKIFHLRRALDDDPKDPRFIETIPRRGYRFLRKLDEPVADATPAPAQGTRLVGREQVLAELCQCLRNAGANKLQVVFITGEPGIGKTAVVEEFQRQGAASDRTLRVARGQCVEGFGSKEGFYPVLEALGELCRGPDVGRLVDTLASHAPTWLVQFPALLTRQHREMLKQEILGATRERMLREICEALEAIAVSSPLLLVLEDLHWADASTLDLISALARRRMPARIMLIATYRPTDVARSTQPLHSLKRDLVARQLCQEMVLEPLTETEIAAYLSGGKPAAGDTRELALLIRRHTEGNPLFMIAVLDHLVERRFVRRDHGVWRLQRPAADISLEVPEGLREMISAQIERLAEAAHAGGRRDRRHDVRPHDRRAIGRHGRRAVRRQLRRAGAARPHPPVRRQSPTPRRHCRTALRVRARSLSRGALRPASARAARDAPSPAGRAAGAGLRRHAGRRHNGAGASLREGGRLAARREVSAPRRRSGRIPRRARGGKCQPSTRIGGG